MEKLTLTLAAGRLAPAHLHFYPITISKNRDQKKKKKPNVEPHCSALSHGRSEGWSPGLQPAWKPRWMQYGNVGAASPGPPPHPRIYSWFSQTLWEQGAFPVFYFTKGRGKLASHEITQMTPSEKGNRANDQGGPLDLFLWAKKTKRKFVQSRRQENDKIKGMRRQRA